MKRAPAVPLWIAAVRAAAAVVRTGGASHAGKAFSIITASGDSPFWRNPYVWISPDAGSDISSSRTAAHILRTGIVGIEGGEMMKRILAGLLALAVLLTGLAPVSAVAGDVSAGPIWNDWDAQAKCPRVCERGVWTGRWRTVVPGMESVCSCDFHAWPGGGGGGGGRKPAYVLRQIVAGPIWGNWDAQNKCPNVCGGRNLWDGNWRTFAPGQSSCDCYVPR